MILPSDMAAAGRQQGGEGGGGGEPTWGYGNRAMFIGPLYGPAKAVTLFTRGKQV